MTTSSDLDIDTYQREFKFAILVLILPDLIANDPTSSPAHIDAGRTLAEQLHYVSDFMREHRPQAVGLHVVHKTLVDWLDAGRAYTDAYIDGKPPAMMARLERTHQDRAVRFIKQLVAFNDDEGNGMWIDLFLGAEITTALCSQFSGIRVRQLAKIDTSIDKLLSICDQIVDEAPDT